MNEKLKPCPFCGGEARLEKRGGYMSKYYYLIRCKQCPACVITEPSVIAIEAEAIEKWNRRAE